MNLTIKERERIAYINGDTETAALLAQVEDNESKALQEMEHELRYLQQCNDELAEDVSELEDELSALRNTNG